LLFSSLSSYHIHRSAATTTLGNAHFVHPHPVPTGEGGDGDSLSKVAAAALVVEKEDGEVTTADKSQILY